MPTSAAAVLQYVSSESAAPAMRHSTLAFASAPVVQPSIASSCSCDDPAVPEPPAP